MRLLPHLIENFVTGVSRNSEIGHTRKSNTQAVMGKFFVNHDAGYYFLGQNNGILGRKKNPTIIIISRLRGGGGE